MRVRIPRRFNIFERDLSIDAKPHSPECRRIYIYICAVCVLIDRFVRVRFCENLLAGVSYEMKSPGPYYRRVSSTITGRRARVNVVLFGFMVVRVTRIPPFSRSFRWIYTRISLPSPYAVPSLFPLPQNRRHHWSPHLPLPSAAFATVFSEPVTGAATILFF